MKNEAIIKDITERLNNIYNRYLTNLENSAFGSDPFSKTACWQYELGDTRSWTLLYYSTPKNRSSNVVSFDWKFKSSDLAQKIGFHMNSRFLGKNLEKAIKIYETRISRLAKIYNGS